MRRLFVQCVPARAVVPARVVPCVRAKSTAGETTKAKGDALERRVVRILQMEGRPNIKTNVLLTDSNGNLSEIDIMYGRFTKYCIECKNYEHSVPLEMVAKFKEVMQLNKIPIKRGTIVTTSKFVPRARTIGIRCIDGGELDEWERRARTARIRRRWRQLLLGLIALACAAVAGAPYYVEHAPPGAADSPALAAVLAAREAALEALDSVLESEAVRQLRDIVR